MKSDFYLADIKINSISNLLKTILHRLNQLKIELFYYILPLFTVVPWIIIERISYQ